MDLYADQNFTPAVVRLFQSAGYNIDSAHRRGRRKAPVGEHLFTAAKNGWILLTQDKDFDALHHAWLYWTRQWGITDRHAGIILIPSGAAPQVFATLDAFLKSQPVAANGLWTYEIPPGSGWQSH